MYNLTTYPHLVGFFEALGVDTAPSDMSFALSMDNGRLEWGSDNLDTVFAQVWMEFAHVWMGRGCTCPASWSPTDIIICGAITFWALLWCPSSIVCCTLLPFHHR